MVLVESPLAMALFNSVNNSVGVKLVNYYAIAGVVLGPAVGLVLAILNT